VPAPLPCRSPRIWAKTSGPRYPLSSYRVPAYPRCVQRPFSVLVTLTPWRRYNMALSAAAVSAWHCPAAQLTTYVKLPSVADLNVILTGP